MQTLFRLTRSVLFLCVLIGVAWQAQAQTNVRVERHGSAAPDGTPGQPYQLVRSGACRGKNGNAVIQPGVYNETLTITDPVLLTASGSATIGSVAGKPHTTLNVFTWNTHLFGDEMGGQEAFADRARAAYIADMVRLENADVVGLQEVWDEELKNIIVQRAGYPHHYYNNDKDEADDFLNSGLLLLSKYPIVNPSLTFYDDEANISDCPGLGPACLLKNPTEPWKCLPLACVLKYPTQPWLCLLTLFQCKKYLDGASSKGFIQATIVKDGFPVGVFVTHTQAEHHQAGINARRKQLAQIGGRIQQYRAQNPGAEVLMMGDLNVIAGSEDYRNTLLPRTGLRDVYPNLAPCLETPSDQATCDHYRNDLAEYFDNKEFDCKNQRLDYVLYSHAQAFDVLPTRLEVRRYQAETSQGGKTLKDLSDHYGVSATFALWRNQ